MDAMYKTATFVGDMVDVASQLQDFCQTMQYNHPDTFTVVSTNTVGSVGNACCMLLYFY
ncbi:MAG: hypothetical protein HDQ88_04490 [Clostridia bacterium]|nr:hypothetical protein [Clostridia bacterium]